MNYGMTFMNPLVSILIPCYNAEKFIADAIRSCLNQTYENIEIIVVDDGSTDNSFAVAKQFESSKIKVVRQANAGACRARNHAFELSRGDLIQFFDADDLLSPDKIQAQVKAYLETGDPRSVITCPWQKFISQPGDCSQEKHKCFKSFASGDELLLTLLDGYGVEVFLLHCYLTPRDVVKASGSWDEKIKLNQDGEFFARVLLHAGQIIYVPDVISYYRCSENNTISRTLSREKIASAFYALQQIEKNLLATKDSQRVREILAYALTLNACFSCNYCLKTAMMAVEEIRKIGMTPQLYGDGITVKIARIIGLKNALRIKALCLILNKALNKIGRK